MSSVESVFLDTTRIRLSHDYPMQIGACLERLDEDQLWWRPHEDANAIGNLILHLCGSNHFYLEHVIAGGELRRDRDAEFAARRTHSRAELIDAWQRSVASTTAIVAAFAPERLMEVTEKTGKPLTLERILLQVTHHNAVHTGQILWITKMLQAGAITDLWKKTKAL